MRSPPIERQILETAQDSQERPAVTLTMAR
jgi:hypothetical protein